VTSDRTSGGIDFVINEWLLLLNGIEADCILRFHGMGMNLL